MYLSKPAGCAFQLLGAFFFLAGIGMIFQGGGTTVLGILIAAASAWVFWRGRRTPEREAEQPAQKT